MRSLLPLLLLVQLALGELLLVQVLVRHGDRTRIHPIHGYPDKYQGIGQLTPIGMHQHQDLGKWFRNRYGAFIGNYSHDSVWIRGVNIDRTLMSAQSNMHGLFPPGTGPTIPSGEPALEGLVQLVPTHTVDLKNEFLLRAFENCPNLRKVRQRDVFSSAEWKKKEADNKALLEKVSTAYGKGKLTLQSSGRAMDTLYCLHTHGMPLPPPITEAVYHEAMDLWAWKIDREWPRTHEVGRMVGGNLLQMMIDKAQAKIHNKLTQRFLFYSAHDTTILSLFAALGVPFHGNPPYASNVVVELHRDAHGAHSVRFLFNRHDLTVPQCGTQCSLDKFISIAKPSISSNWAAECGRPAPGASGKLMTSVLLTLLAVALLAVILLLVAFLITCCRVRKPAAYDTIDGPSPIQA